MDFAMKWEKLIQIKNDLQPVWFGAQSVKCVCGEGISEISCDSMNSIVQTINEWIDLCDEESYNIETLRTKNKFNWNNGGAWTA